MYQITLPNYYFSEEKSRIADYVLKTSFPDDSMPSKACIFLYSQFISSLFRVGRVILVSYHFSQSLLSVVCVGDVFQQQAISRATGVLPTTFQ